MLQIFKLKRDIRNERNSMSYLAVASMDNLAEDYALCLFNVDSDTLTTGRYYRSHPYEFFYDRSFLADPCQIAKLLYE